MDILLSDVKEGLLTVSEVNFGRVFNEPLVHQVVVSYLSRKRQGSKSQKSRAEVSGSGKKPWRQKGTGRARAGSIRSPLWRSGGVTFAAKPKSFFPKVNKKMYKGALRCIFSELIRQNRFFIFKEFNLEFPKTSLLISKLKNFGLNNVLIITDSFDLNLFYASRNLNSVRTIKVSSIDPVSLISFRNVLTTVVALHKIEEILS